MSDDGRPDERDDDIERIVRARRRAAGYRTAARRAIRLARRYRSEEGRSGGAREVACVAQARAWRDEARAILAGASVRPGLARGRGAGEGSATKTKAS